MDIISLGGAVKKAKAYTDQAIASVGKGMEYKGAVASYNNLPIANNKKGYVYTTSDTGAEYIWTIDATSGALTDWGEIGKTIPTITITSEQIDPSSTTDVTIVNLTSAQESILSNEGYPLIYIVTIDGSKRMIIRGVASGDEIDFYFVAGSQNLSGAIDEAIVYDFLYISSLHQMYGSQLEIKPSNYYTKTEIDAKLSSLLTYGGD